MCNSYLGLLGKVRKNKIDRQESRIKRKNMTRQEYDELRVEG